LREIGEVVRVIHNVTQASLEYQSDRRPAEIWIDNRSNFITSKLRPGLCHRSKKKQPGKEEEQGNVEGIDPFVDKVKCRSRRDDFAAGQPS
jgi:hypothetical protein